MNKDLKNRVFDIPQNVLDNINHAVVGLQGKHASGLMRAKKLLQDKTVKYGQLKRIIHDLSTIDKINDRTKYELCGGELMHNWSKHYLGGERDIIKNRKEGRKKADKIGNITGERKNSYRKKHSKKFNFKIPTNLVKSNSHKSSVTPLKNMKLFEEINKIKKLIIY